LSLAINPTSPLLWLSIATWGIGVLVYRQAAALRTVLRRFESWLGWTADSVFDALMFGLIRFSGAVTRLRQHGRLDIQLVVVFAALALALTLPLLLLGGYEVLLPIAELGDWSVELRWPELRLYEWGVV